MLLDGGGSGSRYMGSVLGCRTALDCVPYWVHGPLSTSCAAGSSQLVLYLPLLQSAFVLSCQLLRLSRRRTAANIDPPARSHVSLILDALTYAKARGYERLNVWVTRRCHSK